jgi:23S rRNA pseudouridine1911/1915/1917 synthase
MEGLSRSYIKKLIDKGNITIKSNNECQEMTRKNIKASYCITDGDRIHILLPEPEKLEIVPEDIPIDIVYEDDDLLVVNKQPGLVVHPGFGNWHGTLLNGLAWHMKDVKDFDINNPEIGLVHRIDKDTSGLLVVAKTAFAKTNLGLQFFNKTTRREYNAIVWGVLKEDEGTIIGNIGRNPKDRMQMSVFAPDSGIGKHAVTHYKVLERFSYVTLVKCVLETGRTHQIRVHLASRGLPIFGDTLYGGRSAKRLYLHAEQLAFTLNGKKYDISAPVNFLICE